MTLTDVAHETKPHAKPKPTASKEQIRSFFQRITRMEMEKKDLSTDIRDVYVEAKNAGVEVAALKSCVKTELMELEKRKEQQRLEQVTQAYRVQLQLSLDL